MKRYFILSWVLQILVIFMAFYAMTLIAIPNDVRVLPILGVSVVLGTFTFSVSCFALRLWVKHENVLFIDKTSRIEFSEN